MTNAARINVAASAAAQATFEAAGPPLGRKMWAGPRVTGHVVGQLAAFVRQHPQAPAEALFRYAAELKLHAEPDGWADEPFAVRVAFTVFRDCVLAQDALAAADAAAVVLTRPTPPPPKLRERGMHKRAINKVGGIRRRKQHRSAFARAATVAGPAADK